MEADDYFAINGLIQRYLMLVDRGNFDGVGQLFAMADIVYTGPGETISKDPIAISELMKSFVKLYDNIPMTLHQSGNISIEPRGAHKAVSTSTAVVFQALPDLPLQPIAIADSDDEFEKIDGKWRFYRRAIGMQLVGDLSKHLQRDSGGGGN